MTGVLAVLAPMGSGFRVQVIPPDAYGIASTANVTTTAMQCVVTPNTGGYTYQWINVGAAGIDAISPTSSTSAFRGALMVSGEVRQTNFICRVTKGLTVIDSPFTYVQVERT